MIQITYRLKLGQDEFEIKAEVKNEKEFFQTMSFYSNLPRTAPGGATDLKLVFRTTKKGHKYYSIISEKEQMEFKLGQNLEANGNGLFAKGWEKAYQGDDDDAGQTQQAQAPLVGFVQPQAQQAPAQQAPIQAPIQQFAAPTPMAMPAPAPVQQAAPTPAFQPTPAATPQAAAPAAANPAVTQVANNVLARFGINK